jgi:CRISPR-associated protein Cas2
MMVIILKKAPACLRGELTRWLLEPRSGVFVGHVSALVRDLLWKKCCEKEVAGGVLQIWTTNNEQHFKMRVHGNTDRSVVELEGLQLIKMP